MKMAYREILRYCSMIILDQCIMTMACFIWVLGIVRITHKPLVAAFNCHIESNRRKSLEAIVETYMFQNI